MPLIKKCKLCKKTFKTKPSHVKMGYGKYCSAVCHHAGMKNGKIVKCYTCGQEVYKPLKALRISKSRKWFCSKSCQTTWRNTEFSGPKHANYVDGMFTYRGLLSRTNIPKKCRLCKTDDIRVLAVHHVDENRKNNVVENLVWLCHNCHHLVHHHKDVKAKLMVPMV
jgi:hypothetical protein